MKQGKNKGNKKNGKSNKKTSDKDVGKEIEKIYSQLGINTLSIIVPYVLILVGLALMYTKQTMYVAIALVLEVTAIGLLFRKKYRVAVIWNSTIRMYANKKYDKCKENLEKLPEEEKSKDSYKKMQVLLNKK